MGELGGGGKERSCWDGDTLGSDEGGKRGDGEGGSTLGDDAGTSTLGDGVGSTLGDRVDVGGGDCKGGTGAGGGTVRWRTVAMCCKAVLVVSVRESSGGGSLF